MTEKRLQSRFLASLPEPARAHVFALSAEVARAVGAWAAREPLIRPYRLPQVSVNLAAAGPFCTAGQLLGSAQVAAWLFLLDDLLDEQQLPYDALCAQIDQCTDWLEGRAGEGSGEGLLLRYLKEVAASHARFPLYSGLRPFWAESLRWLTDGMRREHEWSARHRESGGTWMPGLEQYIDNGLRTIGSTFTYRGALICMDDASVLSHLPRLVELERELSICIRLSNDLRTHGRETAEGKVNSLHILRRELMGQGQDAATALESARARLQARIEEGIERCTHLAQQARTTTGKPEAFALNLVRFSCDFYAHQDYAPELVIRG